jgi:hypothetical protein
MVQPYAAALSPALQKRFSPESAACAQIQFFFLPLHQFCKKTEQKVFIS